MRYEMTKDLETGNALIDSEHRQLFKAVNDLLDACSQGKGRSQVESTLDFLVSYVAKHFGDEEKLQVQTSYPGYAAHRQFHEWYKGELAGAQDPGRFHCRAEQSEPDGWKAVNAYQDR